MFLFIILTLILTILTVFIVLTLSVFGAGAIVVFGDVIVCGFIIGWIIKKLFFKRSKF